MVILASATVAVAAAVFALLPLFREPEGNLEVELLAETELDRLLDRKAVVDKNLNDLEFERGMGRLSDADFQRLEAGYREEASQIAGKLDQVGASEDIDETIERAVAERKSKKQKGTGA